MNATDQIPSVAAVYARVSTKREKDKAKDHVGRKDEQKRAQDPENQLRELRAACEREGYTLSPESEYVDRETGTGKRRRSRFEEMLEDAERGKFQVLVIWALDRLSREGTLKTLLHLDNLNTWGVKVRSLREPWLDPTSPTYELLISVFAWVAKQEAMRISERVKAGIKRAEDQGKDLGRKPTAPETVNRIVELRSKGESLSAIAEAVGLTRSGVWQILKTIEIQKRILLMHSAGKSLTAISAEIGMEPVRVGRILRKAQKSALTPPGQSASATAV